MKISLFGTGLMGYPMTERLLNAGYDVMAYNRTQEKASPLKDKGAHIADSVDDAVTFGEILILMVKASSSIEKILFKYREKASLAGKVIIQMSTIAPSESVLIAQKVRNEQAGYLEAPVLGSTPQAKAGELIVMAAGDKNIFDKCLPVLKCFGKNPSYIGETGKAAALKLGLNQLIASLTATFSLSLGFIRRQGVDVDLFMDILRKSVLYAPTFDKKLPRYLNRDFSNPNFPTKHMLKDVNLFLDEAQMSGLDTASLEGVRELIEKAIAHGHAESDYSSFYESIDPQ